MDNEDTKKLASLIESPGEEVRYWEQSQERSEQFELEYNHGVS